MAKKISENAIPDINADWGKDASNGLPYSGQAVQTFIKDTMKSLDSSIKKKVGWWCWSTNIDASNFYHLWGFASEDDCTKYKSDPEANASLLLVNEALPISTVQGDSYSAFLFADVSKTADLVVSGNELTAKVRFCAVKNSNGERLNDGSMGTLIIERSVDGSTWNAVETRKGVLVSDDYSGSSFQIFNIASALSSGKQHIRLRASFPYDDGSGKMMTAYSSYVQVGASINFTAIGIALGELHPYTPIRVDSLGAEGARKFPLSYICTGSVPKTLHYVIYDEDGTQIFPTTGFGEIAGINANGTVVNQSVGNESDAPSLFTHGVKTVVAWLTVDDGAGGTIYSNCLVNRFMVINESDAIKKGTDTKSYFLLQQEVPAEKMATLDMDARMIYFGTVTNYTQSQIFSYALFVPTKNSDGNIVLDTENPIDVTFYLSNYLKGTWTPQADGVTLYLEDEERIVASSSELYQFTPSVEIDSTQKSLYAYLHIWINENGTKADLLGRSSGTSSYAISVDNSESYAPISGTTFLLNPKTRNNGESNPMRILNAAKNNVEVESEFSGFDFQTDGWIADGNQRLLRIPSGRKLNIKLNPLAQLRTDPTSSLVVELDYKVSNVTNEDDAIFQIGETVGSFFRGIRMYPLYGEVMPASYETHAESGHVDDIDFGWLENKKVHITFVFNGQVNPVKHGMKYGTPDVHIPSVSSTDYYKDPQTTTIAIAKVFVDGNKYREIHYSTANADEFCTGAMSNGGINIGVNGADIDVYSLRVYAYKQFSDDDALSNYVASLSTTEEKQKVASDNDILDTGATGERVISIDKVHEKGKNTLLWHGQETWFLNQSSALNGWYEIKKYDINGNYLPKHSGSLCRKTGIEVLSGNISDWNKKIKTNNFPFVKGQGSSAKTYWDWNQQFDMSKFKSVIRIPRSAFDSSIVISDVITKDDGSTVVNIYGGCLGADFPLGNTPKEYPIDTTTGLIQVPDGWIDGNGILIGETGTVWHSNGDEETVEGDGYYRGPCYQVADGTPLAQKLVPKINYASCEQTHLMGVNNLYNDLHTAIVGENDLQKAATANGQHCRVSKYTEPFFYFIKNDDSSDITFRGGCSFGAGKMDKSTWGYAKKFKGLSDIKKFAMFEGSNNSLTGTDFRVPFIWRPNGECPDEMTYSVDGEGFGVTEGTGTNRVFQQCWDFDGGATYSAEDEVADPTHKADYPKEEVIKPFVDFANFVYLHSVNIKPYTGGDGTFDSFKTSAESKDYYTKYWMTQGDDKYRLVRYSFGAGEWVDAGLWVQLSDGTYGWNPVYVNSSEPYAYTAKRFAAKYSGDYDKYNEELIKGVAADFKARLPLYADPKSIQLNYCYNIAFFCGTDNCGKNIYFVLSQYNRDVTITLPDGTTETHTGVCRYEMHTDDVDTTVKKDNNGRLRHKYDADRMHPYPNDDKTQEPQYSGMNNCLFNLVEAAWESDTDNTLQTMTATMFSVMTTLATSRDNILGFPYDKTQQSTVLGCLWKYLFFATFYFPARAYNEQGRIRYEYPETLGFVTARQVKPIWQSQGSSYQDELEFMIRRIVYFVSYAAWGPAGGGSGTGIPDADAGGFQMQGTRNPDNTSRVSISITVTAHQTIWPTGNVGGAANGTQDPHVRLRPGQRYTISLGDNTFENDTYFYVYLRNYYRSFGNLATLPVKTQVTVSGVRLEEFVLDPDSVDTVDANGNVVKSDVGKFTDASSGKSVPAFRPSGIVIGSATNIRKIDVHGFSSISGALDVRNLPRLESVDARQTSITTCPLPATHSLTSVQLPASVLEMEVKNQPMLKELSLEGYSNLQKFILRDNNLLDSYTYAVGIYAAKPSGLKSVEFDHVQWDTDSKRCSMDMLMYFADIKAALIGVIYMMAASSDRALTLTDKLRLCSLYENIDDKSNSLYIQYEIKAITKLSITGQSYLSEVGKDYAYSIATRPSTGNNIAVKDGKLQLKWALAASASQYATLKDDKTGIVHVNTLSDARLELKHELSLEATTIDNETLTASKMIGFYTHIPKVGDFAYADGTFDADWDDTRECVGIVFMRQPVYDADGKTVTAYDVHICGREDLFMESTSKQLSNSTHRWGLYPDNNRGFASSESAIKAATGLTSVFDIPTIPNIGTRWNGTHAVDGGTSNGINYDRINADNYLDANQEDGYKVIKSGAALSDYDGNGKTEKIVEHSQLIITQYLDRPLPKTLKELADAMQSLKDENASATNNWRYEEFYYPAAYGCHLYEPSVKGVLADQYKSGKWYCPACGELERLYNFKRLGLAVNNANDNPASEAVTPIFANANKKAGGTIFSFVNNWYWSVSEVNAGNSWGVYFNDGYVNYSNGNKSNDYYVRPCTAFTFHL